MTLNIATWLIEGERGLSSEAIARTALSGRPSGFTESWPYDPSDLRRCLLLLEQAPEGARGGACGPGKAVARVGRSCECLGRPVGDAALRDRRDAPFGRIGTQDLRLDEGGAGLGR